MHRFVLQQWEVKEHKKKRLTIDVNFENTCIFSVLNRNALTKINWIHQLHAIASCLSTLLSLSALFIFGIRCINCHRNCGYKMSSRNRFYRSFHVCVCVCECTKDLRNQFNQFISNLWWKIRLFVFHGVLQTLCLTEYYWIHYITIRLIFFCSLFLAVIVLFGNIRKLTFER